MSGLTCIVMTLTPDIRWKLRKLVKRGGFEPSVCRFDSYTSSQTLDRKDGTMYIGVGGLILLIILLIILL